MIQRGKITHRFILQFTQCNCLSCVVLYSARPCRAFVNCNYSGRGGKRPVRGGWGNHGVCREDLVAVAWQGRRRCRQGCCANKNVVGTHPKIAILKLLQSHLKAKREKVWERRSHAFPLHYIPGCHHCPRKLCLSPGDGSGAESARGRISTGCRTGVFRKSAHGRLF